MINDDRFYCTNNDTYPPFKEGHYLEEAVFYKSQLDGKKTDHQGRLYIPAFWTNFQIESWFSHKKDEMQCSLDRFIANHPNEKGYFTVVQHDDGPMLRLPGNTIIYGACSGNIPIALVYEDLSHKLSSQNPDFFENKSILCSFVGTFTHPVRKTFYDYYHNNPNFYFSCDHSWSPRVNESKQQRYIDISRQSKFVAAPRGYGRSSFRFFEIYKLGAIPIYIWDDIEWLPYKDVIDYSKICISIHINDISSLENRLLTITPEQYNEMLMEYDKIQYVFDVEYIYDYVFKTSSLNSS